MGVVVVVVVWVVVVVVVVVVAAMAVAVILGRSVRVTCLSQMLWRMLTRSVAKLGLLSSTCVLVFDVVYG